MFSTHTWRWILVHDDARWLRFGPLCPALVNRPLSWEISTHSLTIMKTCKWRKLYVISMPDEATSWQKLCCLSFLVIQLNLFGWYIHQHGIIPSIYCSHPDNTSGSTPIWFLAFSGITHQHPMTLALSANPWGAPIGRDAPHGSTLRYVTKYHCFLTTAQHILLCTQ